MEIFQRPQSSLVSPMQTLSSWHNQGKLAGTAWYHPELIAGIKKNKRLKRQLKVAEEGRKILNEEG